jgi:aminomethyltransferase
VRPVSLLTSPLHDRHVAAGAKLADFSGWSMPIEYAGGGVLAEHTAVREAVGLFDVSHLGTATVTGPGAAAFVDACLTNDLSRIGPGGAQYTLCCDESGGVVDDLIVYLRGADDVLLVPNAANAAEVLRRLREDAPAGIAVTDRHSEVAVLAVQGPHSLQVLELLGLPGELPYMSFVTGTGGGGGAEVTVCRTGYTGEHGYELLVEAGRAGELWDAVLECGQDLGIRPCGLGARDTLRTEMGYPLHGHELSLDITPNQARSGWAVGWKKPAFWGRAVLSAEKEAGPRRTLWGLESLDRGIPRPHMVVRHGDTPVGEVTSGTFSPTRRLGIGLALLDAAAGLGEGAEVEVDVRGRPSRMTVVKPPFVTPSVR